MIDSSTNPTVKAMRALATSKGRREQHRFLVEGVRAVEDGLRAGFEPEVVLYNGDLLKRTERGEGLLRLLLSQGKASKGQLALEASARALAATSDTQHPQGVVAAFRMVEWPPLQPREVPPLLLICDAIQDPGNLGTILRAAEAAGVHAVWLSPGCVDPYNPKVVRAAMGAHFRLPIFAESAWENLPTQLARLHLSEIGLFAADAGAVTPYDAVDWTKSAALIVSNEAHGLSREARHLAEQRGGLISIPMAGGTESLNAAMSAAIILFEAARQRRASENYI
ncbi:MAG TPA: RNA methyltransferase [Chloroflexia bacterium]|nr:RNA methyltransferase [Chloroflexia bacterium]